MDAAAKSARADARVLERDVARWTKERATEERRVTQELKEQDALQKVGVGRHLVTMRSLTSAGLGALAGEVFSSVVDQFSASESLANRGRATDARNQRQFTILNSIRGTSGQVASEAWGAEENVATLKRDRPELEREQKYNTIKSSVEGAAWGMGLGAAVGSIVPGIGTLLGMGIGSVIGGAVKGVPAYFEGKNKLNQSDQERKKEEERGEKLSALAPELFMKQEGGLELDKLRQQSKRTMAGSRAAFADDMAQSWLKTYRDMYNRTKGNDQMAGEMADLSVQNQMRDRQAQAGAGLVDARSGGAEIAAAARWGMQATPGMSDVVTETRALHATVQEGNQKIQMINQSK